MALGGTCWYCYWGWPRQVRDIYDRYCEVAGESALEFGPAHIVWSDENFESDHIRWCIQECDTNREKYDQDAEQVAAVRQSLVELLAIPESIRCCEPAEYEGENPENFPPPAGIEMAHS